MALHGSNDAFIGPKLLQDSHAYLHMSAFHLVSKGFSYIVNESSGFGDSNISTKLFGNHAGNVSHLYGVLQNILPIAGAEVKSSNNSHNAWVEVKYSTLIDCLLSLFFNYFIYFFFCFFHQFFYFGRLNASI